jgi:uncharacterized protein
MLRKKITVLIILYFILIFPVFISAQSPQNKSKAKSDFVIDGLIGDTTEYRTPFIIIRSDKEYPKIIIDAGMHGDEVAGAYACDTVMKYIEILEGSVIFVPRLNINAFNAGVRQLGVDLNHVFPGKKESVYYEERLAYDFMSFIEQVNPNLVINLHEAWTKFDENLYNKQKDKSFGQVLITNKDTIPAFLETALVKINEHIENKENKFRIQIFPYKENHSMDNINEKLKIPSYTVETLRILSLEERINYQIICILTFIKEAGIKFNYNRTY